MRKYNIEGYKNVLKEIVNDEKLLSTIDKLPDDSPVFSVIDYVLDEYIPLPHHADAYKLKYGFIDGIVHSYSEVRNCCQGSVGYASKYMWKFLKGRNTIDKFNIINQSIQYHKKVIDEIENFDKKSSNELAEKENEAQITKKYNIDGYKNVLKEIVYDEKFLSTVDELPDNSPVFDVINYLVDECIADWGGLADVDKYKCRYGLYDGISHTFKEIGERYGIGGQAVKSRIDRWNRHMRIVIRRADTVEKFSRVSQGIQNTKKAKDEIKNFYGKLPNELSETGNLVFTPTECNLLLELGIDTSNKMYEILRKKDLIMGPDAQNIMLKSDRIHKAHRATVNNIINKLNAWANGDYVGLEKDHYLKDIGYDDNFIRKATAARCLDIFTEEETAIIRRVRKDGIHNPRISILFRLNSTHRVMTKENLINIGKATPEQAQSILDKLNKFKLDNTTKDIEKDPKGFGL